MSCNRRLCPKCFASCGKCDCPAAEEPSPVIPRERLAGRMAWRVDEENERIEQPVLR